MIKVSRTVQAQRSLVQVWSYLSDFAHTEDWDPGTVRCRRTDAGPVDVGAKYENTSKFRNKETTLQYEVTRFDAPKRITLRGENKTVVSVDDMAVSGDADASTVTYTAEFTFKGMARLAEPFVKGPLNKLADDARDGLSAALNRL